MKEVPSHEIFCNNAEAFQANTSVIYSCSGTDSDACEGAGGSFNVEAEICENINSLGPNDCEAIPGFTPKTQNTCSDMANYFQNMDPCENDGIRSTHYRMQSICCGGDPANFADVCDGDVDVPTKEEVCESCEYELDTLSQKGVTEGCLGKVETYIQSSTKALNLEGCTDVDGQDPANVNVACKNSVMSNFDCDSGNNEGPITAPTRELICESCVEAMETMSKKGTSQGCFDNVITYFDVMQTEVAEGCDDDNIEGPADVTPLCKNSTMTYFNCSLDEHEGHKEGDKDDEKGDKDDDKGDKEDGKTSAAPCTQAAFVGAAVMVISAVLL